MMSGASAVRGNHDDQALSAYYKLQRPEREVLLMLGSSKILHYLTFCQYIQLYVWHVCMQGFCYVPLHQHLH